MYEVKLNISICKSGEILAKDVTDDRSIMLVGKNTTLNDFIISKLKGQGIETLWVYRKIWNKTLNLQENIETVNSCYKVNATAIKAVINGFASGKRLNYEAGNYIDKFIYANIANKDYLKSYSNQLYDFDYYTFSHSNNVSFYAMLIGTWLFMSENKISDLIQAGLLHDIGKIQITEDILNKRYKLTNFELSILKQHSSIGYEMIKNSSDIETSIKQAILMHHERFDGSGYPFAVKGDCISEYAKIIAIADVYDAMTSDRPYKKKSTPFDAFHMFLTTGANEFDPNILKVFLLNISSYLVGANVLLNNGKIGEVVYIPPDNIDRPIVRVMSSYIEISYDSGPQIDCILN